jgi:MFS family permease
MGVSQSAASLGRVLGPGAGGFLYGHFGERSPYFSGAIGMLAATLVALTLEPARKQ